MYILLAYGDGTTITLDLQDNHLTDQIVITKHDIIPTSLHHKYNNPLNRIPDKTFIDADNTTKPVLNMLLLQSISIRQIKMGSQDPGAPERTVQLHCSSLQESWKRKLGEKNELQRRNSFPVTIQTLLDA